MKIFKMNILIIFFLFLSILLISCNIDYEDISATKKGGPIFLTQEAVFKSSLKIIPINGFDIPADALIANNMDYSFSAVTFCQFHCKLLVIFKNENKVVQIYSATFILGRPFSNLKWRTNEILTFDQWSQPHYGVHYEINVVQKELLIISPFHDN